MLDRKEGIIYRIFAVIYIRSVNRKLKGDLYSRLKL